MLHRPVRVGKIEGFYFNRIRIGKSEIPATANSADSLSIDAIELGLNPLPLLLGLPLPVDVKLINPSIYLDQDKNGQWLDNLEKISSNFEREAPIKLNLGVQVEKAAITIFFNHNYMVTLNPWQDPRGDGYQLVQSLLAIGSGGTTGSGYGLSQQKLFYLPFPDTDFIFAVFGEEFGRLSDS